MITGAKFWHWCSFDERFKDHLKQLKILEVVPDVQYQTELRLRLKMAIKEKNKLVEDFLKIR
jgi:hypothetical protein